MRIGLPFVPSFISQPLRQWNILSKFSGSSPDHVIIKRSENACRLFNKSVQLDKEKYFSDIADETEAEFVDNDLRFAYRAIRHIRSSTHQ